MKPLGPDGFKQWNSRGISIESTLPTKFDPAGNAEHFVVMKNYELFDVTIGATTDSIPPGNVRFTSGASWAIAPVVLDGSGPGGITTQDYHEKATLSGPIPPGGVSVVELSAKRCHESGYVEVRTRIIQHRVLG